MNVTVRNEYRVEIELSREELDEYDITYDELDYANIDTRRVLWTLLEAAREDSGADIDFSEKMLIEVMPRVPGGAVICFTSIPSKKENRKSVKQLVKTQISPLILECDNLDDIISAAAAVPDFGGTSSLYEKNGIYRLFFFADSSMKNVLCAVLSEFGRIYSGSTKFYVPLCDEEWKCIETSSAVPKLSALH